MSMCGPAYGIYRMHVLIKKSLSYGKYFKYFLLTHFIRTIHWAGPDMGKLQHQPATGVFPIE